MALPVTFSSVSFATQNSHHGPFKSSEGNFYAILRDSADNTLLEAHKATDPTDSFTEIDGSNRPDFTGTIASLNVFQVNDKLHIALQDITENVSYSRFDMDTAVDAWDVVDGGTGEFTTVDSAPSGITDACDIAVLSDGTIRIVYQGAMDMDMGGDFERIDHAYSTDDGVNWTAAVSVDSVTDGAGIDYVAPRIVAPPNNSDQVHIVFQATAAAGQNDIIQRALDSSHNLRTYETTGLERGRTYSTVHGIAFVRSGVSKVRVGCHEVTTNDLAILEFDAFAGATAAAYATSNVSTNDVGSGSQAFACLASDGAIIRGMMVEESDDDLFEFFDDGADSYTLQGTEHLAGTITHVSCNIYDRDGPKLAMIYDNAGTVQYDEIALTTTQATLGTVDMGQQNSFHGPFEI